MTDSGRRVVIVEPGDGEDVPVGMVDHLFLLTAEHTAGAAALEEFTLPAGALGARPHVHDAHDEYFYVVRGSLTFHDGAGERVAGPGTVVAAPRGAPHGFRNSGEATAVGLCFYTPAGYEGYFREAHAAVESGLEPSDDLLAGLRARYASWPWPLPG